MQTKLILIILFAAATSAPAQYTLDWSTMDGGGESRTAGTLTMHGTLGQPDAATFVVATGFSCFGGYWSLTEEDTLPTLRMFPAGAGFFLAWPLPSPGWRLQSSSDMVTWSDVTTAPTATAGEYQVPWDSVSATRRYFRLTKP